MAGDEETIRQLDMGDRLNVSRDFISAMPGRRMRRAGVERKFY